jgi:hypothetical protein
LVFVIIFYVFKTFKFLLCSYSLFQVCHFEKMKTLSLVIYALVVSGTFVSVTPFDTKLRVAQDVTLERGGTNFNYLPFLIVGTHPGFVLKRSLVRFQPLDVANCDTVRKADLYLYYAYAHKASYLSLSQAPTFRRTIVAHQVLKDWTESQATSTKRFSHIYYWDQQWLNLGTDALATPTSSGVTIDPTRNRPGFYTIDVTSAVRNWKNGQPNFGLLLRATNEYREGRDFRFASNADPNVGKHAYILVTCQSNSSGGGGASGGIGPVGGKDGIGPAI